MNDMNWPIAEVQGTPDARLIAVNSAGIRSLSHPVKIADKQGRKQHTVALFNMHVNLEPHFKGVHMSRFVEVLNDHDSEISVESFESMLRSMISRLETESGVIEMIFPYFMSKTAPVSHAKSLLDYRVTFIGKIEEGSYAFTLKAVVPVTSLCPCSKQISAYGAHNQRSHITISIRINAPVWIEELVGIAESQASCQLYGLLKRSDEKYVTEKAYENPKFVEDVVRDVATILNQDARIDAYIVESENFESIHNHSAYAMIERDKRSAPHRV